MVLCKFFQQGYCRFGQNCRFEHAYASKYSYHANAPQQSPPAATSQVSDEQLTGQLISDSSALLNGNQWLLTTYTPFSGKPSFPGFMNLSPEEARLFIYEAKASNTLENAITHINNLQQEAKSKYEQLARPAPQIIKVIRSIFNGETTSSPFTSSNANPFVSSTGNNEAGSIFKSAAQGSVFANTQQTPSSIFGPPANATPFAQQFAQAQSIFAQASQNQNVFQQKQDAFSQPANPASIFSSATNNVFQAPAPTANQSNGLFSNWSQNQPAQQHPSQAQSIFAQANQEVPSNATNVFAQANLQSPFQSSTGVFSQSSSSQAIEDLSAYSRQEDLQPEDIEMYMNSDFKLGFVPELPPPQSLCM